jgi:hypothetical protein
LSSADIETLTDHAVLEEVAKNDQNVSLRLAAVQKLPNQAILADIAKNDETYEAVRLAAVEKIQDQSILTDIAKNNNDRRLSVRMAAAKKLADQSILDNLTETAIAVTAKVSNNWDDHYAVKTKLTDQTLLADVAQNANHVSARSFAVEKLANLELVAYIAQNDKASAVRNKAKEFLTDQQKVKIEEERREKLKAKQLCPQCGSEQCKREIRTRQKPQMDLRYSSADSRNLEPVQESVCLKCGYNFISMNPDDVQEMWSRQND